MIRFIQPEAIEELIATLEYLNKLDTEEYMYHMRVAASAI